VKKAALAAEGDVYDAICWSYEPGATCLAELESMFGRPAPRADRLREAVRGEAEKLHLLLGGDLTPDCPDEADTDSGHRRLASILTDGARG